MRDKYHIKYKGWIVVGKDGKELFAGKKKDAIRYAVGVASRPVRPASVLINDIENFFQEERTFPRSSDPKRRKG